MDRTLQMKYVPARESEQNMPRIFFDTLYYTFIFWFSGLIFHPKMITYAYEIYNSSPNYTYQCKEEEKLAKRGGKVILRLKRIKSEPQENEK